jgi:hypothetical protein
MGRSYDAEALALDIGRAFGRFTQCSIAVPWSASYVTIRG